jgi:hypothetical protein
MPQGGLPVNPPSSQGLCVPLGARYNGDGLRCTRMLVLSLGLMAANLSGEERGDTWSSYRF